MTIRSRTACARAGVCLIVALLALASACSSDPAAIRDENLKRGDAFVAEKKFPEAIIAYKTAVSADPSSLEARTKLGRSYIEQGEGGLALREYVRAADLAPDDNKVQLEAAALLLLGGQFEDAKTRTDKVLARDPKNVTAQVLRGNALGGLKDFDGAIRQVEGLTRSDPSAGVGYATLGAIQTAKGDVVQAEAAFKRAIAALPKSVDLRLSLANLYWSTNRMPEAEKLMLEALQLEPRHLLANRAMALVYMSTGRQANAEAPLKIVAEDGKGPEDRLGLADYYVSIRRTPEARTLYEQIAREGGDGALIAKLRLASLDAATPGGRATASRLIEEVLGKQPANGQALAAKARLQFSEGKADEALKTARTAAAASPDSPQVQLVLGRILAAGGQVEEAIAAQNEALKANPKFVPALD